MEENEIEELTYIDKLKQAEADTVLHNRRLEIAEKILSRRDDAVTHRAGSDWERIWREDEEMLDDFSTSGPSNPAPMLAYATGDAYKQRSAAGQQSTVKMNVIRNRCEIAEGRFGEISLPTDDRNWALKTTPIPEMSDKQRKEGAYAGGEPIRKESGVHATIEEVAIENEKEANKRMKKMELVIDDQLVECDFNAEQRKCQRNSIRLGTGVLKGPSVIKKVNYSWKDDGGTWKLDVVNDVTPSSESIDPRRVYPDSQCGDNTKLATYIWEDGEIRPKALADLVGVPGYDSRMINEILEEEPIYVGVIYDNKSNSYKTVNSSKPIGTLYQRWEYNGEILRKDLEELGVDVEKFGITASKVTACIVFVNDKPIKSVLNTLDTNQLPYDFFPWTEVSGTPFGIGLPRRARDIQRIIQAAWQKMMDNAGDSSGMNVVLAENIEPIDGNWTLDGKKAWRALADDAINDVRKSFATFQAENRQPELQEIIELALRFLDIETGIPMIFQGEMQRQPETLGQTNIIVDSSNISLRMRMKLYDDKILDPHITRYYNHNMQYHPDEAIKGDYRVDVRGTRVLLERDNRARTYAQLFQFKADPDVDANTDWDKVIPQWYQAMKISGALNSDAKRDGKRELQAESAKQGDPALAIAKMSAEGKKAEAAAKIEISKTELSFKAEQAALDRDEKEKDRLANTKMKEMDREIAMLGYAADQQLSITEVNADLQKSTDKVKADLTTTSAKLQTQKEIALGTGKVKEVIKPATEPPGRAPNNEAFQR